MAFVSVRMCDVTYECVSVVHKNLMSYNLIFTTSLARYWLAGVDRAIRLSLALPSGGVLCARVSLVLKQRTDEVDLHSRHQHHHQHVGHGPHVDSVVVGLLYVAVAGFEGSEQRLYLKALPQPGFNTVDGVLESRGTKRLVVVWVILISHRSILELESNNTE